MTNLHPNGNGSRRMLIQLVIILASLVVGGAGWSQRGILGLDPQMSAVKIEISNLQVDVRDIRSEMVTQREFQAATRTLADQIEQLRETMREGFREVKAELREQRRQSEK